VRRSIAVLARWACSGVFAPDRLDRLVEYGVFAADEIGLME
jgi:hypothetical protein